MIFLNRVTIYLNPFLHVLSIIFYQYCTQLCNVTQEIQQNSKQFEMHLKPNPEDEGKITKEFLKKLIKSDFKTYYSTPELNDALYLHYKGFNQICNLESYTGLKVLYLEGNAFKKIQGLETLLQLRCLYLQQNLICKIENLEPLVNLVNLNLSDNQISKIQGLQKLTKLTNLQVKRNRIGSQGIDDVKGLLDCPSISALDISDNYIETEQIIPQVLQKMPQIAVVYLQNNKFNKKVAHYRKTLISKIATLKYIDDKPIFEDQRRYAEAWARGGLEQQRKERELYKKQQEQKQLRQHREFKQMMDRYKEQGRKKRQAEEKEHSSENESDSKEQNLQSYHTPSENQRNSSRNQTDPSDLSQQSSNKEEESDKEKSQKGKQQKEGYLDELD